MPLVWAGTGLSGDGFHDLGGFVTVNELLYAVTNVGDGRIIWQQPDEASGYSGIARCAHLGLIALGWGSNSDPTSYSRPYVTQSFFIEFLSMDLPLVNATGFTETVFWHFATGVVVDISVYS